jgi:hypothetical protein
MKMDKTAINKLLVPIVIGGAQAGLTLSLEKLSVVPEGSGLGRVQQFFITLLSPGMFGAMLLGNNVHAWSLWVAAIINGLFYFGVAWGVFLLGSRLMGRA